MEKNPYKLYDIQKDFIEKAIKILKTGKIGIFSSPTGTGKTLSLLTSLKYFIERSKPNKKTSKIGNKSNFEVQNDKCDYLQSNLFNFDENVDNELKKVIEDSVSSDLDNHLIMDYLSYEKKKRIFYVSRTHSQLQQVIKELKTVVECNAVVVGSRKLYCINDDINKGDIETVNLKCSEAINDCKCVFYANYETNAFLELNDGDGNAGVVNNSNIKFKTQSRNTKNIISLNCENNKAFSKDTKPDLNSKNKSDDLEFLLEKTIYGSKSFKNSNNENCSASIDGVVKTKFSWDNRDKNIEESLENTVNSSFSSIEDTKLCNKIDGIMDIEDFTRVCVSNKICPYYMSKNYSQNVDILFMTYNLLFSKEGRKSLNIDLKDSIIVVDEAHNLTETIIQMNTVSVHKKMIEVHLISVKKYLNLYGSKLNKECIDNLEKLQEIFDSILNFFKNNDESKSNGIKNYNEGFLQATFYNNSTRKLINCENTSTKVKSFDLSSNIANCNFANEEIKDLNIIENADNNFQDNKNKKFKTNNSFMEIQKFKMNESSLIKKNTYNNSNLMSNKIKNPKNYENDVFENKKTCQTRNFNSYKFKDRLSEEKKIEKEKLFDSSQHKNTKHNKSGNMTAISYDKDVNDNKKSNKNSQIDFTNVISPAEFLVKTNLYTFRISEIVESLITTRLVEKLESIAKTNILYTIFKFLQLVNESDENGRIFYNTNLIKFTPMDSKIYFEDLLKCKSLILAGGTMEPIDDIVRVLKRESTSFDSDFSLSESDEVSNKKNAFDVGIKNNNICCIKNNLNVNGISDNEKTILNINKFNEKTCTHNKNMYFYSNDFINNSNANKHNLRKLKTIDHIFDKDIKTLQSQQKTVDCHLSENIEKIYFEESNNSDFDDVLFSSDEEVINLEIKTIKKTFHNSLDCLQKNKKPNNISNIYSLDSLKNEPKNIIQQSVKKLADSFYFNKNNIEHHAYSHVCENHLSFILPTGSSNKELKLFYGSKEDDSMIKEYTTTLYNLANALKDGGVVCFLPSKSYIDIIRQNIHPKMIDMSMFDSESTFSDYQKRINQNKKTVLFAVMGGKLSEGINFNNNLCRLLVILGIPYPTLNLELKEREKWHSFNNNTASYSTIVAMKQVNQAIGRAIRHKNDYAGIVLMDVRYKNLMSYLSTWVKEKIKVANFQNTLINLVKYYRTQQND
ncbi:hypothetical protein EDEG_00732 [Edhazardia aedis USNM 41457]|uniref:ATP-dependent DNA helicase CHL1 n=1 Tax=Edhazardia aedis (strain USNM 41457) TaxID=1003232 RepID=J9DRK8_EDHAE|nr:hypothetical protein EDEG_00732 [Edhazardia aedis USNM 41457]|eukprot:EJW05200.1 hypothetical protein EDEG_00732 [Edhazardia aedis USNM 41457]